MENNDIIYISVNSWCPKKYYPDIEPFSKWMEKDWLLDNNKWAEKTKVCILVTIIDMSFNYEITATRDWVEKHCPEIFERRYSKFIKKARDKEVPSGRFGIKFLEYKPSNFGVIFNKEII